MNWSSSCFSVVPEGTTALKACQLYGEGLGLNQFKQGLVNYELLNDGLACLEAVAQNFKMKSIQRETNIKCREFL